MHRDGERDQGAHDPAAAQQDIQGAQPEAGPQADREPPQGGDDAFERLKDKTEDTVNCWLNWAGRLHSYVMTNETVAYVDRKSPWTIEHAAWGVNNATASFCMLIGQYEPFGIVLPVSEGFADLKQNYDRANAAGQARDDPEPNAAG